MKRPECLYGFPQKKRKMQIYFIDSDAKKAAQSLINEHISSQILDAAHILCNAHRVLDGVVSPTGVMYYLHDEREPIFYKTKDIHNPWSVWCQSRVENYVWISDYLFHLLDTYKLRFKKKHRILTFRKTIVGMPFMLQSPPFKLKEYDWTNPPLTMHNSYKQKSYEEDFSLVNIIKTYRYYYMLCAQYIKPYEVGIYFNKPPWIKEYDNFLQTLEGNN